jgi:hypothetical protein
VCAAVTLFAALLNQTSLILCCVPVAPQYFMRGCVSSFEVPKLERSQLLVAVILLYRLFPKSTGSEIIRETFETSHPKSWLGSVLVRPDAKTLLLVRRVFRTVPKALERERVFALRLALPFVLLPVSHQEKSPAERRGCLSLNLTGRIRCFGRAAEIGLVLRRPAAGGCC